MRFYILGASGFLGGGFVKYLRENGHEVLTERVDITNLPALKSAFNQTKPDVVVNFAGVRAYPTIDWCEDHKEETVAVNVAGAINAMVAAIEAGAYPIQISSGCIYTSSPDEPYKTEEDSPNFTGSFYSRMRVVMQEALKELPCLQLRIRMPISMYPHPRNFIDKIISYEKVINIPNSVTLIEDMYPAIVKLAEIKPTGILNLTNDGYLQHHDVLEVYKEIVNPDHHYVAITLEELQGKGGITKAQRSNCILDNSKVKSLGIEMPALNKERLKEIMKVYKDFQGE